MEWKFETKTDIEKIEKFAKALDYALRDDAESFLLEHNNGRPVKCAFDTQKTKERTIKKVLSYNSEDIENVYDFESVFKDSGLGLYPFATDSFGNFICFRKSDNTLVFWSLEDDGVEHIADSVREFVDKLY